MNNAKVERVLQSAGLPFSYEESGVVVHLEGMDMLSPRVASGLRTANLELHSVNQRKGVTDVIFKESGMGGFF